ncbi:mannitol-1-phosphate 5-dehydrogenase [Porphyromonadaceae bacterium KHP3R9]|nr:mannitol-1-phosphate 5-dehydrogenase [Porphyromonadaceae bacterium KHP3R9]
MEKRSILIVGAGKIGRSLIGQLFGMSGYEVVFSDIDKKLVDLLNREGSYKVVVKGESEEQIVVPNVRAVDAADREAVAEEVRKATIMAVSVGKNALLKIVPSLVEGLTRRFCDPARGPLDIILAENMRSADQFLRNELKRGVPENFPLDEYVGLIETSIGKMVPIISVAELEKDPLTVFAEPYNLLIVDRQGFRNELPDVAGLAPKDNIKAWVDRKAFIHNLGHAAAAYYGYYSHPDAIYLYEVLDDHEVLQFTREVMLQSAAILLKLYPDDFTTEDLSDHIEDLLCRFRNRALRDTLFRIGQDIPRKLGPDDRFMGVIRVAISLGMPHDKILEAMAYAFFFKATDENGNRSAQDLIFERELAGGVNHALQRICGIDLVTDRELSEKIKKMIIDRQ